MKSIFSKKSLFLSVVLIIPTLLFAQKRETTKNILSEKVEVTKDYIPTISKASKRDITPSEEDNIRINMPKLNYSINYKPEKYPFQLNYLEIPSYKKEKEEKLYNGYADLMLGAPLSSRANIIYTTSVQRYMVAGVALHHDGFFGKIVNPSGQKLSATQTNNDLSLYFDYQKDNLKFKASAEQSYDLYTRNGYHSHNKDKSLHYLQSRINAEIGTSFADINQFNVKFYGSFNTISDKYKYNESIYHAGLLFSKGLKKINSLFEGRIEYLSIIPDNDFILTTLVGEEKRQNIPGYADLADDNKLNSSGILSVAPRYVFKYKGLNLDLGVNMIFDFKGEDNNYKQGVATIIPEIEISYSILSGAIRPYAKLDGKFINNNYSSLVAQNPYILPGLTAPNSSIRRYLLGIDGTVGSSFRYEVYGGIRQSPDLLMFVNVNSGDSFSVMREDFDNLELGLQVGYILNSKFNFNLDMKYIDYEDGDFAYEIAYGYAPLTATFAANITPIKPLSISLIGTLLSKRTFMNSYEGILLDYTNEVGAVFDLSLNVGYKLTERLGVSLKGENLLNQKLYQYNNYRGVGLNVLVGASYQF